MAVSEAAGFPLQSAPLSADRFVFMEINVYLNRIKDLAERAQSLRGYL